MSCFRSKSQTLPQTTAKTSVSKPGSSKCMMCTAEPIGITFRPCGHSVACVECSKRMKQCFSCHERIQEKVLVEIVAPTPVPKCMMCVTEPVGIVFRPCGHRVACIECSRRMKNCFDCKQPIQEKICADLGEFNSYCLASLTQ